jgi:outer membrane autotransporter protein
LVAGVDNKVGSDWTIGAGVNSGQVNSSASTFGGRTTIHDWGFSLYTQYAPSANWYINGRLGIGGQRNTIRHTDVLGNVAQQANVQWNGRSTTLDLESGYHFHPTNTTTLTPIVALHADRLHINSFQESGVDAFGLSARSQNSNSTSGTLGLRAAQNLNWGSWDWSLQGYAMWTRMFSGFNPTINAYYQGNSADVFGVSGLPLARSSWNMGASLSAKVSQSLSVSFGYDRVSGSGEKGHAVSAQVDYRF